VLVEEGAGVGSGYPDEDYVRAGAKIVEKAEDLFGQAEMIVKVKEPLKAEWGLLRKGQILFTYLHLAASKELTEALLKSGVTGVAYETIQVGNKLPLLEPMSEIAGRMSIVMGAYYLAKHNGGNGVLLGGVPGVLPGKVVVLGGGTAGVNAARMAVGLCADVTILEVDGERMRFLDLTMPNANTLHSNEAHLNELMPATDLLIGAVLVPGAKAPKLITRAMLQKMRPGSVLVDIAIDQGGCVETSRPTTHLEPVYVEEGVIHYCGYMPPPMRASHPGPDKHHALRGIAGRSGLKALAKGPALTGGINTRDGWMTVCAVAEAHGLKHEARSSRLACR
jgi:alanine dehydrogenase